MHAGIHATHCDNLALLGQDLGLKEGQKVMLVGCTVEDIIQVRQSAIPSETTQAAFALLACQVGAASAAVSVSAPSASSFGTPHCCADHSGAVYADRAAVRVRLRTSRAGSAVCFASDDSSGSAGLSQQAQHKKARAISASGSPAPTGPSRMDGCRS